MNSLHFKVCLGITALVVLLFFVFPNVMSSSESDGGLKSSCAFATGSLVLDTHTPEDLHRSYGSRIIHQSWISHQLPSKLGSLCQTWNAHHHDALHIVWSDDDNARLVREHYSSLLPLYESLPLDVQRADMARLMYIHRYGGLYVDMDYEAKKNVLGSFSNTSDVLVVESLALWCEVQQNSFMYSRAPNHPFFLAALDTIELIHLRMTVKQCKSLGLGRGCDNMAFFQNPFTRKLAAVIFAVYLTGPAVLDKTLVRNYHKNWKITLLSPDSYFNGDIAKHHQLSTWSTTPKIVMAIWPLILFASLVVLAMVVSSTCCCLCVISCRRWLKNAKR